ncbi:TetR/AcrR family transcriptional regulator [Streptomyces sp. NPDC054796]
MGSDRLTEVLDATYDCLARYGVRRTTMDDIATAMGVSRSALYQYVRSKDDAVTRLAERLHARALERARRAATSGDPLAERIHGVLRAKLDLVLELAGDSPHTVELLDAKGRLFGDICHRFGADLRRLLTELFAEAARRDDTDETGATGGARGMRVDPAEAADICVALVIGLEATPDGSRLLRPAADALLTGLLDAPEEGART